MGDFGFGVRAETVSCPELKIECQHYAKQLPVSFIVATNFGTPTIRFPDGTVLNIHNLGQTTEYILTVSKTAMAKVKKQYEE